MHVPMDAGSTLAPRHAEEAQPSRAAAARRPSNPCISVIMPTISWSGTFAACGPRVLDLIDAASCDAEFLVAFDGIATDVPAWLERPNVRIVFTGGPFGPAVARNRAVDAAAGDVLYFVDADVELADDAIDRVHAAFAADPGLVGLFGTYDDEPAAPGLVSRFRNLLHHHTHVSNPGRIGTFWAGCGAMRTANFMDVGGFDERYENPSVEDIALGMRVQAEGGRIMLDPLLQCKHHKRWTLASMVMTDIFCRAIPWTRLIVKSHRLPATLNIEWGNRVSGALAVAAVAASIAAPFSPWPLPASLAAIACLLGLLALNLGFYLLCLRQGGPLFAAGSFLLHVLYYLYSSLTFAAVVLHHRLFGHAEGQPPSATAAIDAGEPLAARSISERPG